MSLLEDRIMQTFAMKDRHVNWIVEGTQGIQCNRCRTYRQLPIIKKSVIREEALFEFYREHMECPAPRALRTEIL